MARYLVLLGIVLLTSACAGWPGVVPYGPMSARGGYQEEEIEPGVWRILARSAGEAGPGYARTMAEYRAGELLKARGFSHVQILKEYGRWELSEEQGGGRRRVLSDQMEMTVRGAQDRSPPTDCREPSPGRCWTFTTDAMMTGARPRLKFPRRRFRAPKATTAISDQAWNLRLFARHVWRQTSGKLRPIAAHAALSRYPLPQSDEGSDSCGQGRGPLALA